MIKDLNGAGNTKESADFLVVGGGTVGLFLSIWLAEAGNKVVCLESGGLRQDAEEHALNEVVQTRSLYRGATSGRYRCIGGTSTRWGGALIPFQEADLISPLWPIRMADLVRYIPLIEREFKLASGPYELPELSRKTHTARLAKWPRFKNRNVFNLLKDRVSSSPNLTVWINATVTNFSVVDGLLRVSRAESILGDTIEVTTDRTILAAGAIESTRLLHILDATNSFVVSRTSPALGRYFADHLSAVVGQIVSAKKRELNYHVGFRFGQRGTMRNLRFELSDDPQIRANVSAGFGHIGFETSGRTGFDFLRGALQSVQKGRPPPYRDLLGLLYSAPWLFRTAWMMLFNRRLLFPDNAKLTVHMVIDQELTAQNRITLSKDRVDIFGNPLAEIAWSIGDADKENLARAVDAFEEMWKSLELSDHNHLVLLSKRDAEDNLASCGGIFHPTGSTRMAITAKDGVVDPSLRVFAVPNLQIVSTSTFPTGGGANPTMTLLLFAARCVSEHVEYPL